MTGYTHVTAPTQFAGVDGVRLAYRRFGTDSGTPLLFFQHFRGNISNWDPAVTDGLAAKRPVILFDNAGIGASSGDTAETAEESADCATAFLDAIGVSRIDALGHSLGGFHQRRPSPCSMRTSCAGSCWRGRCRAVVPARARTRTIRRYSDPA